VPVPQSSEHIPEADADQLRRERDLYRRLLALGSLGDIDSLLREIVRLLREISGAHQCYLEIVSDDAAPRWWAAEGLSEAELEDVRRQISRGIISRSLSTGETIVTESARNHAEFGALESVRLAAIEAVVCAPIGKPPIGVVYLQRRLAPGGFGPDLQETVELVATHVAPFVDRLLHRRRSEEESDPTRSYRERLSLDGLIGRSPCFAALLKELALAAPLDVAVLMTGPSGTGKTEIARAIHRNSRRAKGPFIELNCAAIPQDLVESELFGALPGAHSTATRKVEGKVGAAEGGTLLLDEVGDLPLAAQGKLLQLLQSHEYYPLGSAKPVRADVRIVAATNVDLERAVADKRFREDLYYRLHVLRIHVPSLDERRADIPLLATHLCANACERHGLPRLEPSPQLLRALEAAEWPGNVRQLLHRIEAAAIRSSASGRRVLEVREVFPEASASVAEPEAPLTFQEGTRRYQAELVRRTLEETDWNVQEGARRLEITRSHLYTLINSFGIEVQRRRGRTAV
jgi:Nif-specific regulatory protein